MSQRRKVASVVDEVAAHAVLLDELRRESAVKRSRIKPTRLRAEIEQKLGREGFEVVKTWVRLPLRRQLEAAVQHGALIPLKSLASHIRGASAADLKALVEEAVRDGTARLVLRGTVEVLAGADVRILSPSEVDALRVRVVGLAKTLEKVTRKRGLSLIATDVTTSLSDALAVTNETSVTGSRARMPVPVVPLPHDDAIEALLEAVDSTRDVRTGLSFVPAVAGRLAPELSASMVVKLLLSAAERELLELRPEGGIGRLSAAELSVCPPGPHDTRLSWARRLTGGVK